MDCPKKRRDTEGALGLPDDPLVEILSRVPAKSLCRFKCVSKAWRDLIADPLHRKKLPQALEGFFFMVEKHYCHGESGCDEPCSCDERDDDSDGEEGPCYGFVDVLQRTVRLVDFSYLTELPGITNTRLLQCCNGLVLFAVQCDWGASWSYVVCNPAAEQCVAVPSSGLTQNDYNNEIFYGSVSAYLLFDPAAAPWHFNLVQFSKGTSVDVYSSKTQAWSRSKSDWSRYTITPDSPGVYVNGMLHLLSYSGKEKDQLTVLDVEGNIQKMTPPPCQAGRETWTMFDYIGRSQGCFYYINHETPDDEEIDGDRFGRTESSFHGILIWALEDYERQQWVLKDTVSFSKLFGERNVHKDMDYQYEVVGIHPDYSLVFLVQFWDQKLISYHMDSKEVRDLCTLGHDYECITPYVPCFSELLDLENKQ